MIVAIEGIYVSLFVVQERDWRVPRFPRVLPSQCAHLGDGQERGGQACRKGAQLCRHRIGHHKAIVRATLYWQEIRVLYFSKGSFIIYIRRILRLFENTRSPRSNIRSDMNCGRSRTELSSPRQRNLVEMLKNDNEIRHLGKLKKIEFNQRASFLP